ncbi:ThiF family adenylyltransferase [Pseudactinotalea sp. Z1739]|uniref:ThiF family adenylyltransferase n=1 Tax=Pseudactinotalea sp. Z1739 TaxID=3413028 RepID=UPI003C7BD3F1
MTSLPPLVEPVPALSATEAARTARQTLLPEFGEIGQRRLAAARVLVVGAGGLGAPVLQYLAAAGVGGLTIIDDDVVEASNLHRQVIHAHEDLGSSKAQNARRRVLGLNPGAQVRLHEERLTDDNAARILTGHDLVLDGTDTFATRYLVADTCAELAIPLVWGSVLRFDAQVSVFWSAPPSPAAPVTMRDLFPRPPAPGTVPSCAEAGVIGSLCGIAGSMMATEAIKLITGMGQVLLGRVAVIDALTMRVHEVPLHTGRGAHEAVPAMGETASAPGAAVGDPLGAVRPPDGVTTLDLGAFQQRRDRTDKAATVLLDVREPDEAAHDALPGAVNVPISALLQAARGADETQAVTDLLRRAGLDDEQDVVTYCSAGVRAARATRLLTRAGWTSAVLAPGAVDHLRQEPELV